MPGKGYPKDRVATTKYEHAGVQQGNKPVSNSGSDHMKTGRAGNSKKSKMDY